MWSIGYFCLFNFQLIFIEKLIRSDPSFSLHIAIQIKGNFCFLIIEYLFSCSEKFLVLLCDIHFIHVKSVSLCLENEEGKGQSTPRICSPSLAEKGPYLVLLSVNGVFNLTCSGTPEFRLCCYFGRVFLA